MRILIVTSILFNNLNARGVGHGKIGEGGEIYLILLGIVIAIIIVLSVLGHVQKTFSKPSKHTWDGKTKSRDIQI